jgi:hypothetical protein
MESIRFNNSTLNAFVQLIDYRNEKEKTDNKVTKEEWLSFTTDRTFLDDAIKKITEGNLGDSREAGIINSAGKGQFLQLLRELNKNAGIVDRTNRNVVPTFIFDKYQNMVAGWGNLSLLGSDDFAEASTRNIQGIKIERPSRSDLGYTVDFIIAPPRR